MQFDSYCLLTAFNPQCWNSKDTKSHVSHESFGESQIQKEEINTLCPGKERVYGLLCITLTNLSIFS